MSDTPAEASVRRPISALMHKTIEQRTLDVLERIEALLIQHLGDLDGPVDGDLTDVLQNIEPTKTPFTERLNKPKGRGKR